MCLYYSCVVYCVVYCTSETCFISSHCSTGLLNLQNEYVCTYVFKSDIACVESSGGKRAAHKVLVRKHEGRIPIGRHR